MKWRYPTRGYEHRSIVAEAQLLRVALLVYMFLDIRKIPTGQREEESREVQHLWRLTPRAI
jgi:hypothetical protein